MRHLGGLAVAALLYVALPNCSSSDDEGGVCGQLVDSLIAYYNRCGHAESAAIFTTARDRYVQVCANALSAPGATNFGGTLQQCASSYGTIGCNEDADCGKGTTGTLADGAACGEDYQCSSGDCDAKDHGCGHCSPRVAIGQPCTDDKKCVTGATCVFTNSDAGTCMAKQELAVGAPCGSSNADCAKGLHCKSGTGTSTSAVCTADGAAGAACQYSSDCQSELRCRNSVCATGAAEGQDCGNVFNDACASGLSCDPSTKTCVKITFAGTGQPCDDLVRFCARGRCKGSTSTTGTAGGTTVTPGTCEDPLPDGAACQKKGATSTDPSKPSEEPRSCDVFADCVDNTCQLPNPGKCQ